MPSHYTVVQYVPNPLADERINLGFIAWDEHLSVTRFTKNWSKAKAIGGNEVHILKQISQELQVEIRKVSSAGRADAREELLARFIRDWGGKVQFTAKRGSLRAAEDVAKDLCPIFIPTKQRSVRGRTRRSAINLAVKVARSAAAEFETDKAAELVRKSYVATGQFDQHKFDLAIANGSLIAAMNAFSFEGEASMAAAKDIDASAWAFEDLHKANPRTPLGVFVLPPKHGSVRKDYTRAVRIFGGIGATVITDEPAMKKWTGENILLHTNALTD